MFRLTCTTLWKLLEYFKQSYLLLLLLFFFPVYSLWQKGSEQILAEANFVEGSRSLSDLGTGSYSALHLYRVFHLAIYPPVLLLPTERERERQGCLFLIDFSSPHTPTLPYIATGIVPTRDHVDIPVSHKCNL